MKKSMLIFALSFMLFACSGEQSNPYRGVYLLLDTSGTYTEELKKAQQIINYYLGTLTAGDSFAVARIDSGSFSEKDIIAKVTFDGRPSQMNAQKREFASVVNTFVESVESAQFTDISGGLLQAIEFLNETDAGQKYVLIYSDLREELPEGYKRDFSFELEGFQVFALNVTKLREDNIDPMTYLTRLSDWQQRIESGGGVWRVVNDLDRTEALALQ